MLDKPQTTAIAVPTPGRPAAITAFWNSTCNTLAGAKARMIAM
jgi:hypothetical protein